MRDSFILYTSFYSALELLSDEQLGRLFKAIFEYQISGNENVDDDIKIGFSFIKIYLDGDINNE